MTLHKLSAHDVIDLFKKKKVTAYEIIQDIYDRIDKVDGLVKAFLILNREDAFKQAKEIDIKFKNGEEPLP
ncbi:MAG: Asp-tRNA(Asn)/Glu-tRNA(Gln) amidotransferase subunit GatA, partial [Atribacterota bacterium]